MKVANIGSGRRFGTHLMKLLNMGFTTLKTWEERFLSQKETVPVHFVEMGRDRCSLSSVNLSTMYSDCSRAFHVILTETS